MMTSNQLTADQRATARMFGRPIFAVGAWLRHGRRGRSGAGARPIRCVAAAVSARCGWPGAYGSWWQADPGDGSVLIFLAHNMLELHQMARGYWSRCVGSDRQLS